MATPAAPWLLRAGALLILVSPLLPQAASAGRNFSPAGTVHALKGTATGTERAALAAGLFAPMAAGLVLAAGSLPRNGGPTALRLVTLCLLLALSFGLATLGSIILSDSTARPSAPSYPLTLAVFAVPLLLSSAALARWMEGGFGRSTGAFERAALAVLVLLHGLFLADSGWIALAGAAGAAAGSVRTLPGVWVAPAGALLAAAGAILASLPPRRAVDSAPASG
ncbi:MAG TPA: hypothetical protein VE981_21750 [Planctomycetota bacterium]|nr:hypothetical protein [Planctomycetota bacterium]